MFFGEMLCLLPFFLLEWRYSGAKSRVRRRAELQRLGPAFRMRRVLVFAVPAACDAVATTLLNVGLFYTLEEVADTLVVVVELESASGGWRCDLGLMLGSEPGVDAASAPLFGDLCVVVAQAFTALQFILEEKFVAQYRVPTLLAVGLEGMWGTAICAVVLPVLAVVHTGTYHRPIDSAVQQVLLRSLSSCGEPRAAAGGGGGGGVGGEVPVVVVGPRASATRQVWGPGGESSDMSEYTMARLVLRSPQQNVARIIARTDDMDPAAHPTGPDVQPTAAEPPAITAQVPPAQASDQAPQPVPPPIVATAAPVANCAPPVASGPAAAPAGHVTRREISWALCQAWSCTTVVVVMVKMAARAVAAVVVVVGAVVGEPE
ncbi:hypothetical protein VOLCADRAFT_92585 [Volvox carteri f. nagariensis]|uniref:Uncharacterized protein n=1 Tax=Volvox carteri f. nagariensis TaxID=3068 RepID=D8U014_VOLCA|nr:uncharacterized protein VOLCADRAFT_92585 [Volvox carteri f. nagariensis]EFJ46787.1 hypothetical protein VOLCADRAFT_92585 [Volvox carteri f. nagariensis]|eukprot:XP_002951996.1 hypothetical protein VOLCADRAFT_92585 [Volvox carteri f. nagariensis]